MERFKVLERETKTKAYSKEGLGGAAKLDPAQKEKEEMNQWLSDSIDRLNVQIDKIESDVEANTLALKKKKSDKEKMEKIDELKERLEKHRYHVYQLETLMRMLDNATIAAEDVKNIREDLEFYMVSTENSDPDYTENEYIYADIDGMDSFDDYCLKKQGNFLPQDSKEEDGLNSLHSTSPIESAADSPVASPGLNHSTSGLNTASESNNHHSAASKPQAAPVAAAAVKSMPPVSRTSSLSSSSTSNTTTSSSLNHHPHSGQQNSRTASHSDSQEDGHHFETRSPAQSPPSSSDQTQTVASTNNKIQNAPTQLPLTYSKVIEKPVATEPTAWTNGPASAQRSVTPGQKNSLPAGSMSLKYLSQKALTKQDSVSSQAGDNETAIGLNDQQPQQQQQPPPTGPSLSSAASLFDSHLANGPSLQQHKVSAPVPVPTNSVNFPSKTPNSSILPVNSSIRPASRPDRESSPGIAHSFEAHVPPILGVAPLGPCPLSNQSAYQLRLLEAAARHTIHPADSQRLRYLSSTRSVFDFHTFLSKTQAIFAGESLSDSVILSPAGAASL